MSYSARSAFPTWRRRSKSHERHEHDPERVPEVSDMRRLLHESVGLFGIRWEGGGRVEPARMGTGPVACRRARPERGGRPATPPGSPTLCLMMERVLRALFPKM